MGTPVRYNVYDTLKNYKAAIFIGGRQDEDFAYNFAQDIGYHESRRIHDQLLTENAILSGFSGPTLNNGTGQAIIPSGVVFIDGRAELVPGTTLNYGTTVQTNTIYLQWLYQQVTAIQDATLIDPNTLSPIYETYQVVTSLSATTPDAFDETFDTWTTGGLIQNSLGTWVLNSGSITQGSPPNYGNYSVQLNYNSGTATTITSPSFNLVSSTTYTVYYWTKTVYGQTDLQLSDGASIAINISGSPSQTFATTGGTTLLGGYTQHSFTFGSGSATSGTVTISIPSTASHTTQILFDTLLITSQPLSSLQINRHFIPIFTWVRPTTPTVLTPVVATKTQLVFADINGSLPGTRVSGLLASNVTLDHNAATDITGPDGMSALSQLASNRALVAGSTAQTFQVANSIAGTMAPSTLQIQQNSVLFGVDSGTANNYIVTLTPAITTLVAGQEVKFIPANTNTAASTLNVNGTGIKTIYKYPVNGINAINAGEIQVGQVADMIYDGTNFRLLNPTPYYSVQQNGYPIYAADTGSVAGQYIVNLLAVPVAYTAGLMVQFKANTANPGGGETLNLNSLGAKSLLSIGGYPLVANDIIQNQIISCTYDGTQFQMTSPSSSTVVETTGITRKKFKNSLNTNGYTVFPSGLIMQWFTTPGLTSGTPYTATLPLALTTEYLFGFCTQTSGGGTVTPIGGNLTQVTVNPGAGASGVVFTCVVLGI